VGFVVDKAAPKQIFLRALLFHLPSIPPIDPNIIIHHHPWLVQ
jgi:hypothetical protein